MDFVSELFRAAGGGRARPGPPPSQERRRELAKAIAEKRYQVSPEEIAKALLRGRAERRD
jgi:hypothetical protein